MPENTSFKSPLHAVTEYFSNTADSLMLSDYQEIANTYASKQPTWFDSDQSDLDHHEPGDSDQVVLTDDWASDEDNRGRKASYYDSKDSDFDTDDENTRRNNEIPKELNGFSETEEEELNEDELRALEFEPSSDEEFGVSEKELFRRQMTVAASDDDDEEYSEGDIEMERYLQEMIAPLETSTSELSDDEAAIGGTSTHNPFLDAEIDEADEAREAEAKDQYQELLRQNMIRSMQGGEFDESLLQDRNARFDEEEVVEEPRTEMLAESELGEGSSEDEESHYSSEEIGEDVPLTWSAANDFPGIEYPGDKFYSSEDAEIEDDLDRQFNQLGADTFNIEMVFDPDWRAEMKKETGEYDDELIIRSDDEQDNMWPQTKADWKAQGRPAPRPLPEEGYEPNFDNAEKLDDIVRKFSPQDYLGEFAKYAHAGPTSRDYFGSDTYSSDEFELDERNFTPEEFLQYSKYDSNYIGTDLPLELRENLMLTLGSASDFLPDEDYQALIRGGPPDDRNYVDFAKGEYEVDYDMTATPEFDLNTKKTETDTSASSEFAEGSGAGVGGSSAGSVEPAQAEEDGEFVGLYPSDEERDEDGDLVKPLEYNNAQFHEFATHSSDDAADSDETMMGVMVEQASDITFEQLYQVEEEGVLRNWWGDWNENFEHANTDDSEAGEEYINLDLDEFPIHLGEDIHGDIIQEWEDEHLDAYNEHFDDIEFREELDKFPEHISEIVVKNWEEQEETGFQTPIPEMGPIDEHNFTELLTHRAALADALDDADPHITIVGFEMEHPDFVNNEIDLMLDMGHPDYLRNPVYFRHRHWAQEAGYQKDWASDSNSDDDLSEAQVLERIVGKDARAIDNYLEEIRAAAEEDAEMPMFKKTEEFLAGYQRLQGPVRMHNVRHRQMSRAIAQYFAKKVDMDERMKFALNRMMELALSNDEVPIEERRTLIESLSNNFEDSQDRQTFAALSNEYLNMPDGDRFVIGPHEDYLGDTLPDEMIEPLTHEEYAIAAKENDEPLLDEDRVGRTRTMGASMFGDQALASQSDSDFPDEDAIPILSSSDTDDFYDIDPLESAGGYAPPIDIDTVTAADLLPVNTMKVRGMRQVHSLLPANFLEASPDSMFGPSTSIPDADQDRWIEEQLQKYSEMGADSMVYDAHDFDYTYHRGTYDVSNFDEFADHNLAPLGSDILHPELTSPEMAIDYAINFDKTPKEAEEMDDNAPEIQHFKGQLEFWKEDLLNLGRTDADWLEDSDLTPFSVEAERIARINRNLRGMLGNNWQSYQEQTRIIEDGKLSMQPFVEIYQDFVEDEIAEEYPEHFEHLGVFSGTNSVEGHNLWNDYQFGATQLATYAEELDRDEGGDDEIEMGDEVEGEGLLSASGSDEEFDEDDHAPRRKSRDTDEEMDEIEERSRRMASKKAHIESSEEEVEIGEDSEYVEEDDSHIVKFSEPDSDMETVSEDSEDEVPEENRYTQAELQYVDDEPDLGFLSEIVGRGSDEDEEFDNYLMDDIEVEYMRRKAKAEGRGEVDDGFAKPSLSEEEDEYMEEEINEDDEEGGGDKLVELRKGLMPGSQASNILPLVDELLQMDNIEAPEYDPFDETHPANDRARYVPEVDVVAWHPDNILVGSGMEMAGPSPFMFGERARTASEYIDIQEGGARYNSQLERYVMSDITSADPEPPVMKFNDDGDFMAEGEDVADILLNPDMDDDEDEDFDDAIDMAERDLEHVDVFTEPFEFLVDGRYAMTRKFQRMGAVRAMQDLSTFKRRMRWKQWYHATRSMRVKRNEARRVRSQERKREYNQQMARNRADPNMHFYPTLGMWLSRDELKNDIVRNAVSGALNNPTYSKKDRKQFVTGVMRGLEYAAKTPSQLTESEKLAVDIYTSTWEAQHVRPNKNQHNQKLPFDTYDQLVSETERLMDEVIRARKFDAPAKINPIYPNLTKYVTWDRLGYPLETLAAQDAKEMIEYEKEIYVANNPKTADEANQVWDPEWDPEWDESDEDDSEWDGAEVEDVALDHYPKGWNEADDDDDGMVQVTPTTILPEDEDEDKVDIDPLRSY